MEKLKIEVTLPKYINKHIENIEILFQVDTKTLKHEAYIPMSLYLKLLDKVEELSNQLNDAEIEYKSSPRQGGTENPTKRIGGN